MAHPSRRAGTRGDDWCASRRQDARTPGRQAIGSLGYESFQSRREGQWSPVRASAARHHPDNPPPDHRTIPPSRHPDVSPHPCMPHPGVLCVPGRGACRDPFGPAGIERNWPPHFFPVILRWREIRDEHGRVDFVGRMRMQKRGSVCGTSSEQAWLEFPSGPVSIDVRLVPPAMGRFWPLFGCGTLRCLITGTIDAWRVLGVPARVICSVVRESQDEPRQSAALGSGFRAPRSGNDPSATCGRLAVLG